MERVTNECLRVSHSTVQLRCTVVHPIGFDNSGLEPRYNRGPRDWENMFAITRFRCIEVLFHTFYYRWGEEYRSLVAFIYSLRTADVFSVVASLRKYVCCSQAISYSAILIQFVSICSPIDTHTPPNSYCKLHEKPETARDRI